MEGQKKEKLYIDWILLTAVALLTLFGLVMIYSASYVEGYTDFNNPSYYFNRQLRWFVVSSILLLFFMFFPYRHFQKLSPWIVLVSIILLVLIFIPGVGANVGGATRWIDIFGVRLQPSEFVKLGSIIYLAYIYSRKQSYINKFFTGVLPPLIVVLVFFVLIMEQPDLGTATTIVIVAGLIAFSSGARKIHIFSLGALAGFAVLQYAISAEYRMNRLIGYRTPFELEGTDGFQLVQSYIAIAHGGLSGAGLGESVQKLFYLPEAHTDFILAVVSEELGVIGIAFVFACMLTIIFRGILIGVRCKDTFGSLLAFGIIFQLALQMIFNAGAVSGVLPITGIPFPFISYGGSSLMVIFTAMGILANISRRTEKARREHDPEEEEWDNHQLTHAR